MSLDTVVSLIGSLGFPIVVCGACFWFINNTMKELQSTMAEVNKTLEKIVAQLNKKS